MVARVESGGQVRLPLVRSAVLVESQDLESVAARLAFAAIVSRARERLSMPDLSAGCEQATVCRHGFLTTVLWPLAGCVNYSIIHPGSRAGLGPSSLILLSEWGSLCMRPA